MCETRYPIMELEMIQKVSSRFKLANEEEEEEFIQLQKVNELLNGKH
jgi:hypothetical protein